MKTGHPFFTIFGLLVCGYLATSHARGWLLFSSLGSNHGAPPTPGSHLARTGTHSFSHK